MEISRGVFRPQARLQVGASGQKLIVSTPWNFALDHTAFRSMVSRKTELAVEAASQVEGAPLVTEAQWGQLILSVSRAFDAVIDSLSTDRDPDSSFIAAHLAIGLPLEPLLETIPVLAGLVRERLSDLTILGEREATALIRDLVSRFNHIEASMRTSARMAAESHSELAARTAAARMLLHSKKMDHDSPALRQDKGTAYLVLALHHGSVSRERLETAVRRAIGTNNGQQMLPVFDTDDPVLLVPSSGTISRQNYKAGCAVLLETLDLDELPVAGLAYSAERVLIAESVHEAVFVARTAFELLKPPGTYTVDDLWQELLLRQVPDFVEIFKRRVATLSEDGNGLLRTLRVYLDGDRYRARTAAELGIHPNTLDNRLRRIQKLTGLNPQLPKDAATLDVALTAWSLEATTESRGGAQMSLA